MSLRHWVEVVLLAQALLGHSPARSPHLALGGVWGAVCCSPAFSPAQQGPPGVPESPTAPRPGQTDTPGGKDGGAKVRSPKRGCGSRRSSTAGPRAWQTIAVSLLALPAGRIRRRSLMNQGEHPATGCRNPLICGRRRTPPAPCAARRSPACLTPGRQRANKGAARGGRQRLPPPPREAAAAHKARSPAAMGVRSAPARPIVWAPLCSSGPPVPNRTGRNSGSRTDTALLEGAPWPGLAVRARLAHGPTLGTRAYAAPATRGR